jgi:hypothetical protein
MPYEGKFYTSREAAQYLNMAYSTLKYHVYTVKDLKEDHKIGRTLVFTRDNLDSFKKRLRKGGRPSKNS